MQLDVQILTTPAEIRAISAAWDELVHDEHGTLTGVDGTMSYAWFDALHASFAPAAAPAVVTCRQNGLLVGLLPAIRLSTGMFGTSYGLHTELYGGRCAPLLSPAAGREVLRSMLSALSRHQPNWATLQLTVEGGGPIADELREASRLLGWQWAEDAVPAAAYFPLLPAERPLRDKLPAKVAQNVRSALNRASKLGERLRLREFSRPEDADELFTAILTIERESWKHQAGSAITNHPQQEAFYAALLPRAMRDGILVGSVLYLDDAPIAHNFGLLRDQVYCCLKHSHVQSQDALSPSNLLMADLLERLPQMGAQTFDWMGVVEPHKLRWSPNHAFYERITFLLFNDTWRGRASHAMLASRKAVKQLRARFPRAHAKADPNNSELPGESAGRPAITPQTITVLSPGPALAALEPQWDALVQDDPACLNGQDSSSTYCWFAALTDSREEAANARVLVSQRQGQLQGLLPLICHAQSSLGSQVRTATEIHGGRNGMLLRQCDAENVAELLQGIEKAYPDWVTLQSTFVQGSESLHAFAEATETLGWEVHQQVLPPVPYVQLLDSATRFNAGVSRSVMRNMRSSLRQAATLGQLTFREFRDPVEAEVMMATLLDVERHSWKHEAGTSITQRPEQEAFYRALVTRAMHQGLLYVLVLYLDDVPISYQLGLLRDGVYSCLKNSMHQGHGNLRPSYLIKAELFDRLRAMGVSTVDLMGVAEAHKMVWADPTPTYQRVLTTTYRPSIQGRALALSRSLKSKIKRPTPPVGDMTDTVPLT